MVWDRELMFIDFSTSSEQRPYRWHYTKSMNVPSSGVGNVTVLGLHSFLGKTHPHTGIAVFSAPPRSADTRP